VVREETSNATALAIITSLLVDEAPVSNETMMKRFIGMRKMEESYISRSISICWRILVLVNAINHKLSIGATLAIVRMRQPPVLGKVLCTVPLCRVHPQTRPALMKDAADVASDTLQCVFQSCTPPFHVSVSAHGLDAIVAFTGLQEGFRKETKLPLQHFARRGTVLLEE
jgi:hypothetical protein